MKADMSPTVGHIRNPIATRNRNRAAPVIAGVMLAAPEGLAALAQDLRAMAETGVEIIVIDGGDGTVREVLSRAPAIWADAGKTAPRYAIIASGNTNLIARKVGAIVDADMVRLAADAAGFRETTVPLLQIDRTGQPPLTGFIMGAGAYETATRMAQEQLAARHGLQVVIAVLRLIFGPALRTPTRIGFGADAPPVIAMRTLIGVTTLPGALIYGLNPFWTGGTGPLRWLDIAAPAPRLLRAVARILLHRPAPWMAGNYRCGTADRITLRLETPFVVDGESFAPGPDGMVHLSAETGATFLASR